MGVALALYAAGNIYWQLALSDLAAAPYPSLADALWLGVCPSFYLGVVLLVRERMPHLDSRLWLDGIVAALTTAGVSAALVFGALQVSTGGDPAAVATNLAYPLGDMILLASVIGAMAAGRSRLDRSWLWFGAGIADLCRRRFRLPLAGRQGDLRRRHAARHRLARGRTAGGHRRVAALGAQALHGR